MASIIYSNIQQYTVKQYTVGFRRDTVIHGPTQLAHLGKMELYILVPMGILNQCIPVMEHNIGWYLPILHTSKAGIK